ncbi:MAG TPA: cytochrome P450 [Rugosimonospora sp.]|nr:cytochrome P450 [Rugosimonospora sp.]
MDAPIAYPFPPSPSLYQPSPIFGQLREECPVAQVVTPTGFTAWVVTRHTEVRQVLVDPRFSRALAASPEVPKTALGKLASESILGMDPPEHTRLRKLVARAFTARRVEELRPRVTELVDELLLAMQPLPRPVDLVEHFSLPLPVQVICELLGVPAADRHVFHAWSDTLMGGWQRDPADMERALEDLKEYFRKLIAAKRAEPAGDLMTALIAARDEQDRLSEYELVMLGLGLLIAGHETTANMINMFLLTLLHHPAAFARLGAEPELIPQAVEELMRFSQLGDGSGAGMPRVTTEEVELGGVRLPAGAVVMAATVAANRDPGLFTDPDRLDLDRGDVPHLAFGAGVHHCLGAPLARMELQEALRGLLRHVPDLRVVVPDSELRFKRGMVVRSLEALPVTW